eukprot:gene12787-15003_t
MQAYVTFNTKEDQEAALLMNKKLLGQRYIEVKHTDLSSKNAMGATNVISLQGMNTKTTEEDVRKYFGDYPIENITFTLEARVVFDTADRAQRAFDKVIDSKPKAVPPFLSYALPNASDAPPKALEEHDYVVVVKGVPFTAEEDDIIKFFKGLDIEPPGIMFCTTKKTKRRTGTVLVSFTNIDDKIAALERTLSTIGLRTVTVEVCTAAYYRYQLKLIREESEDMEHEEEEEQDK